jgi:ATP-binding cassette subfamily B protein
MVTKTPARAGRGSAGRIVPLFRPYRLQVAAVILLIVVTSTIGIINPLLIQVVFNKALFVPGGPNLHLLYVLVGVMAVVRSSTVPSASCRPMRPPGSGS